MKQLLLRSIVPIAAMLLLTNCTGSEAVPDNATQTGAVTGAVAGSVIGYNTGNNSGRNAVIGGVLGALAGGAIGSAVDEQNPPAQENGGWE